MKDYLKVAIDSPWKLINEVLMYVIKPFVLIYLLICGVKIGKGAKFYGFPKIFRHRGSSIVIGSNFECRNWWFSNPLGINHPLILSTWGKGAKIAIGDDVGISGGSIVAATAIEIGDGVLIGANSTIIDTDFHPVRSESRRYDKTNIKSMPVRIGDNVFVGMDAIVLKGAIIDANTIVPAGSVTTRK